MEIPEVERGGHDVFKVESSSKLPGLSRPGPTLSAAEPEASKPGIPSKYEPTTFEEKMDIYKQMKGLPKSKLPEVLKIVQDGMPNRVSHDSKVVELEIDHCSDELLRKLQAFLRACAQTNEAQDTTTKNSEAENSKAENPKAENPKAENPKAEKGLEDFYEHFLAKKAKVAEEATAPIKEEVANKSAGPRIRMTKTLEEPEGVQKTSIQLTLNCHITVAINDDADANLKVAEPEHVAKVERSPEGFLAFKKYVEAFEDLHSSELEELIKQMTLVTTRHQVVHPGGGQDPTPENTDQKWEIVDLTVPLSPSYSPSENGDISDEGEIPKKRIAGSKLFTKAKRTGTAPVNTRKTKGRQKPGAAAANKVTKSAKKQPVLKKPAIFPRKITSNTGEVSKTRKPSLMRDKICGSRRKNELGADHAPENVPGNSASTWGFSGPTPVGEKTCTSQELFSKTSEVVQALNGVRDLFDQKNVAAKASQKAAKKTAAKQQRLETIKIAKEKLHRATERATRVKASLDLLTREVSVANNDVIEASEQLCRANAVKV